MAWLSFFFFFAKTKTFKVEKVYWTASFMAFETRLVLTILHTLLERERGIIGTASGLCRTSFSVILWKHQQYRWTTGSKIWHFALSGPEIQEAKSAECLIKAGGVCLPHNQLYSYIQSEMDMCNTDTPDYQSIEHHMINWWHFCKKLHDEHQPPCDCEHLPVISKVTCAGNKLQRELVRPTPMTSEYQMC